MINASGKTVITRKSLSTPMAWLKKNNMLNSNRPMLDYGCGKGSDAKLIGMDKYDLNHFPTMPQGVFDVITCNYVLNVIQDPQERQEVVDTILAKLDDCGTAYIAVRNDLDTDENGFTTSKGTWQGNVSVPRPFGLIHKCSAFRLYSYTKL